MRPTDLVLGTVITDDLGLQKHFSRKKLWLLTVTLSFLIFKRKQLLIFNQKVLLLTDFKKQNKLETKLLS